MNADFMEKQQKPQVTWRGHRPQPKLKYEIRISKYETILNDKNSMLKTLRKPRLVNTLQLCILKNALKKQEIDGNTDFTD